jgi:hypothetical protein
MMVMRRRRMMRMRMRRRRRRNKGQIMISCADRVRGSRPLMCKPSHQQFFELCLWMNCDAHQRAMLLEAP